MTTVENTSQTTTLNQGFDHDIVHQIIDNLSRLSFVFIVVDRVYRLVVTIIFISTGIDHTTTMSAEMKEESRRNTKLSVFV